MDGTYENGREKYLIAPFKDVTKKFKCECDSCKEGFLKYKMVRKLFWIGLFCPLGLLYEVSLFIYIQYYLNHRILMPDLNEQDYPTEYERQLYLERSTVTIEMSNWKNEDILQNMDYNIAYLKADNAKDGDINHTCPDDVFSHLDSYKYEFLKQIATDIVDSHDYYRSYYLKWTLRSLGAIVGQVIIMVIVVVLCAN